jgi:hypothetical protein|tara:strand:+ start:159 stop:389 length:231 start_codon:yes stop_codon:yes gene_type:complete
MNVTFYILVGFLVGIAVMCGMVIAVSVQDNKPMPQPDPEEPKKSPDRVVFKKPVDDHYTYNTAGKKRKVVNIKYRD